MVLDFVQLKLILLDFLMDSVLIRFTTKLIKANGEMKNYFPRQALTLLSTFSLRSKRSNEEFCTFFERTKIFHEHVNTCYAG